jgi:hypothetical protein
MVALSAVRLVTNFAFVDASALPSVEESQWEGKTFVDLEWIGPVFPGGPNVTLSGDLQIRSLRIIIV